MTGERDDRTSSDPGGMAGDAAAGEDATFGTGDAHRGKDGRRPGEPMNAGRQVPSSGATGGLDGGSGAD